MNASRLTAERILADLHRHGWEVVHVPEGMRLTLRFDRNAEIERLNRIEAAEASGT
jgi:hypothetical protein